MQKIIDDADSYAAVRKAVDDTGGFVGGLWLSFVSLNTYLLVVVWSIADGQLFLETPVKLPLVDVSLPLYGFFVVAPIFLLTMHAYLLLHLVSLSIKVGRYEDILSAIADPLIRRKLRQQIPSLVPIQFFSSSKAEAADSSAILLKAVGWLTIVVAPLFFLLLLQWRFLPYQDSFATWEHRVVILLDVVLLWMVGATAMSDSGPRVSTKRLVVSMGIAALPVLVSFCLLTFPGESIERFTRAADLHRLLVWKVESGDGLPGDNIGSRWSIRPRSQAHRDWLENNPQARRFVNATLKLSEFSVVDEEKLEKIIERTARAKLEAWAGERTFRLSAGRSMFLADLGAADLRRTDLRGANFTGANLAQARLNGALLDTAIFEGATMVSVQLQGASLYKAQLQSAALGEAELQGAVLDNAKLQGASLDGAKLQGASLQYAKLQGASLRWAHLQGATLVGARLMGVALEEAQLQGASLDDAWLHGASLDGAQLQGASLRGTQLHIGSLIQIFTFRATTDSRTTVAGALVRKVIKKPIVREDLTRMGALSDAHVKEWSDAATRYVVDQGRRIAIEQRLRRLRPEWLAQDRAANWFWQEAERKSTHIENGYQLRLAIRLEQVTCEREGSPHVARGLMSDRSGHMNFPRLMSVGAHILAIVDHMERARVNREFCPGLEGFKQSDWKALAKLVNKAPKQ